MNYCPINSPWLTQARNQSKILGAGGKLQARKVIFLLINEKYRKMGGFPFSRCRRKKIENFAWRTKSAASLMLLLVDRWKLRIFKKLISPRIKYEKTWKYKVNSFFFSFDDFILKYHLYELHKAFDVKFREVMKIFSKGTIHSLTLCLT